MLFNTLMFMKLYLLDYFEKNNSLPTIDRLFVNSCMKIMCKEAINGRPPKKEVRELKDKLLAFYNTDFKPFIQEETLDYTHLNNVLEYLTISLMTMYENNIKMHYVEYVERYINVVWKKKDIIRQIKEEYTDTTIQTNLINEFCRQLRKLKLDILDVSNVYKSDEKYHSWFTDKQGKKHHYLTEGNLKKNEDKIWNFFFRTERKCFNKPKYSFHHMIETDGVSSSILMLRNDMIGKRIPTTKISLNTEQYIDELKDYSNIKNKKIVSIDPGMSDIIYCVDNDNKYANEFRYTQDSRRKECKIKKYSKLILQFKEEKRMNRK